MVGEFISDSGSCVVKCGDDWQDVVANHQAENLWRSTEGTARFSQSLSAFPARATFRGKVGFGAWKSAPLFPISWNNNKNNRARDVEAEKAELMD